MTDPASARVFVSYSRKDGAAFAADLREMLLKQAPLGLAGHCCARRRTGLVEPDRGRADAPRRYSISSLCVTLAAPASPVVRREFGSRGRRAILSRPVRGPGLGEPRRKLPRWFGNVYELDPPEFQRPSSTCLQRRQRAKARSHDGARAARRFCAAARRIRDAQDETPRREEGRGRGHFRGAQGRGRLRQDDARQGVGA